MNKLLLATIVVSGFIGVLIWQNVTRATPENELVSYTEIKEFDSAEVKYYRRSFESKDLQVEWLLGHSSRVVNQIVDSNQLRVELVPNPQNSEFIYEIRKLIELSDTKVGEGHLIYLFGKRGRINIKMVCVPDKTTSFVTVYTF